MPATCDITAPFAGESTSCLHTDKLKETLSCWAINTAPHLVGALMAPYLKSTQPISGLLDSMKTHHQVQSNKRSRFAVTSLFCVAFKEHCDCKRACAAQFAPRAQSSPASTVLWMVTCLSPTKHKHAAKTESNKES